MHTILEGVISLEVGCVLYSLIDEKHLLSVDELNDLMVRFWQTITVDKKSRPSEFTKIQEPGCGLSNSMKATQCWSLLKYLPLIIGHRVPEDDEHWLFLLHLSDLVHLIFAQKFTTDMVRFLKEFISDNLSKLCSCLETE